MNLSVLGEGCKDSTIAIIGEAPGEQEERDKRPFVGASGKHLNKILQSAGILRDSVYLTNVVKERPHNNNIALFIDPKTYAVTPLYEEYENFLYEELRSLKANVFVPLGWVALWAVARKKGISKWRGSIIEAIPGLQNRKTIASMHPSYCLKDYPYTFVLQRDLRRVSQQSTFPNIIPPRQDFCTTPTASEVFAWIERLSQSSTVSVDIETAGNCITCIGFADSFSSSVCIPFLNASGGNLWDPETEANIVKGIASILENPSIKKIGQNINYDATFLYRLFGIRCTPMEDTMIAHRLLFPDLPAGLDFQCSTMTEVPYYKDDGKSVLRGWDKNVAALWEYNCKDTTVTFECFRQLSNTLRSKEMVETYDRQKGILEALIFMQEKGIRVNVEALREESKSLDVRIQELETKLKELTQGRLENYASTTQLKKYFYETLGQKKIYSKDGKVTTDVTALKKLATRGVLEAPIIMELRKIEKLKSTYLEMKFDEDSRLRCFFNPTGAVTGRLSSRQSLFGTGGNMQNLTPEMKQQLVADEGYFLAEFDLSQAENRIVAYVAPEPRMIHAFESGIDLHRQTYALMMGMAVEDVSDEEFSSSIGDGSKSMRYWGKQFNHSLNYGLGFISFAERVGITTQESKRLIELYHTIYPGVRNGFHAWVRRALEDGRTVTNCYGRKRVFMTRPLIDQGVLMKALAYVPQSTVADKINSCGLSFVYNNPDMPELVLLNQVHDSIIMELPLSIGIEKASSYLSKIKDSLEIMVPWKTPFVLPAELKCGFNLGKVKHSNKKGMATYTPVPKSLEKLWKVAVDEKTK